MIPHCPECERRDRDERFDRMTSTPAVGFMVAGGLIGMSISVATSVLFMIAGAVLGVWLGWRAFQRDERERARKRRPPESRGRES